MNKMYSIIRKYHAPSQKNHKVPREFSNQVFGILIVVFYLTNLFYNQII